MNDLFILHCGDALEKLKEMPSESVQCCITSPPYFGLRDYGVDMQLGLEKSPAEYIARLVGVFREVKRVLKADGTLWVNLGDSYSANREQGKGQSNKGLIGMRGKNDKPSQLYMDNTAIPSMKIQEGMKPKNLLMIPARVAIALQEDGWYLRSDIIWAKPNPMPESVTDRPTKSHEYLFLLAKNERYYYDHEAIKENSVDDESLEGRRKRNPDRFTRTQSFNSYRNGFSKMEEGKIFEKRNKRTVWTVVTQPYSEAHFATYPVKLIEPCILAGTKPDDIILDPFCGSGTTGYAAIKHGRKFIGIELNPDYITMARKRIGSAQMPLELVND